ncbi:hypothetical protein CHU92_14665 [Flavobacterium cyanobacteriorum]|uniref:Glycosyl transferase family 1 domain-containing protein n=1 Tax=Flavobacterium cyanobacteriorum TaxID=2022802 RepID=A0A255YTZ2_9FLAO|nr:glycosyltransferase [Flavobacterium cyanobacteriorum]OYQ32115.1 hypothetical protein CHU92_14665 [Flavobacterium cyanobacteriorum]
MYKKRIAVVGPCINMGGIERASATMANFISTQGHTTLYLAIFRHPRFFKLNPDIEYDEPLDGSNVTKLSLIKTIIRIRKKIIAFNPDAVLAYNKFYASLTLIALVGLRKKIIISERSSPLFRWKKNAAFINKLATLLNPPAGVIAQTSVAFEHQYKYYGPKVKYKIIPNALREVTLYPHVGRNKWILAVGRFADPLKGFDLLIEAFAKIKAQDWKLVFAGGDEDGEYLKELSRELGVHEKIIYLGKVKEIDKVYAQAGIFVIPSRSEGFPNALCEAMAAGLPCISFDFVAGPRDIITDGVDGIIVENGNTDKLAAAIDDIITDEPKRLLLMKNAPQISDRLKTENTAREVLDFILS